MARQVKARPYRSFRLSKRVKPATKPLPGAIRLFRDSWRHLRQHPRLFLTIVLIYLLLTVVFVKGFGISSGVEELKTELEALFEGAGGRVVSGLTLFGVLVSSAGTAASDVAGTYQSILLLMVSLALIWALRQTHAKQVTTAKESFYKGMYPMVPFLLVLAVLALQLLPIAVGAWLYEVAIGGGLAVSAVEQGIILVMVGLTVLLSAYMLASSVFALYIVTLPDMTPMKALRSARELVRHRRWTVMRKVLALPLFLVLIGAAVMVPLIILVTPLAEWTFLVLNMAGLAAVHAYLYSLYRELL